jgi:hypothetical protein
VGYEKLTRPLRVPGANLGAAEIRTAQLSLTAAQVKALRATPQALVAAPGEGFALQLLGGTVIYDYTAVFTETADNLVVRYTNGSGAAASAVIETTGFLDQTADQIRPIVPVNDAAIAGNAPLILHNNGDGEFGGTGSPLRVVVEYLVVRTGL